MTPLRQAMIDAMTVRGFSPRTHKSYLSAVSDLARYYQRSPEQLSTDELQAYFLYLVKERQLSSASCRLYLNAVTFLYREVLKWPELPVTLQVPKKVQRIPQLLTRTEVRRIIQASDNLKHRMMLSTCYGCGLRVSELAAVKVCHIDGERGLLRVEQGKGAKDRQVILSPSLLSQLRYYWRRVRPRVWLFPSNRRDKALGVSTAQKAYHMAKERAEVTKVGGIHALRHAYATHQLEAGLPVHQLQHLLGHRDLASTLRYVHWVPQCREGAGHTDLFAGWEVADD